MNPTDKYLAVTNWARNRYKRMDGSLTRCVGNGVAGRASRNGRAFFVPSRATLIEDLAAVRYLGCTPNWPGETLATAYTEGKA